MGYTYTSALLGIKKPPEPSKKAKKTANKEKTPRSQSKPTPSTSTPSTPKVKRQRVRPPSAEIPVEQSTSTAVEPPRLTPQPAWIPPQAANEPVKPNTGPNRASALPMGPSQQPLQPMARVIIPKPEAPIGNLPTLLPGPPIPKQPVRHQSSTNARGKNAQTPVTNKTTHEPSNTQGILPVETTAGADNTFAAASTQTTTATTIATATSKQNNASDKHTTLLTAESTAPLPKRRGRPPKKQAALQTEESVPYPSKPQDTPSKTHTEPLAAEPTSTPRPRGRPPKQPATLLTVEPAVTSSKPQDTPSKTRAEPLTAESTPMPRPRGRPPKQPAMPLAAEPAASASKSQVTASKRPAKPLTTESTPTPRARGRPPKQQTESVDVTLTPLTRKPRGRPKVRLATSSDANNPDVDTPQPTQRMPLAPATSSNGRKKKDKSIRVTVRQTRAQKRKVEELLPAPAAVSKPARQPQKKASSARRKKLAILASTYKLTTILEGHVVPLDTEAENKNIWACEFEPTAQGREQSKLVALCGANHILFLDTEQGRYTKKFTHFEPTEEFLCLAWTTLTGPEDLLDEEANEGDSCNILAAAGMLGSIKLINTTKNESYRYLFGHAKEVLKLQFSKQHPRWLLSASTDRTIRLWDIGTPKGEIDDALCLAKFTVPLECGIPSAVSLSRDDLRVMIGCDNGYMHRCDITQEQIELMEKNAARRQSDPSGRTPHTIQIKSTMVYPCGDEWHEGYMDDLCILGSEDGKHELDGYILSRGSDDYEAIVWDPETSTATDADIAIAMEWPDAMDEAGLRFKVVEKYGRKAMVAGDYDGQIRVFNFGDGQKSETLPDNSKTLFQPIKILSHAKSSALIRDVTLSDDTTKIVAVNSANMVFIWSATS